MDKDDLILQEVRNLRKDFEEHEKMTNRDLRQIFAQIAVLNYKSGMWGAGGGAVTLLVLFLMKQF